MKKLSDISTWFGLFVLAMFLYCCRAKKIEEGPSEFNLRGKVKMWAEFTYDSTKTTSNIDSAYSIKTAATYDRGERMTSSFFMYYTNGNKTIFDYQQLYYDNKGRLIRTQGESGKDVNNRTYSINKNRCLVEMDESTKVVYNRRGQKDTLYNIISVANGYKKTSVYIYDNKHDLVKQTDYNYDGSIRGITDYTYDNKHRKIIEVIIHIDVMEMNEKNEKQNIKEKRNYQYDDYGNVVMEIDSNDMRVGSSQVNKPAKVDNNIKEYKYSLFDKRGNWLRQQSYNSVVLRKIEYY